VGANGATLRAPDGRIELTIPAGALAATVQIQVLTADTAGLPAHAIPQAVFSFLPHGLQFAQPVQLRLALPADTLAADDPPDAVGIAYLNPGEPVQDVEGSAADDDRAHASASIAHFSRIGLIRRTPQNPISITPPDGGACPSGTHDVCAALAARGWDAIAPPDAGCSPPPNAQPILCRPQCVRDGTNPDPPCEVFVTGATQDQCPPGPGCCLRTSSRESDTANESFICTWAEGSDFSRDQTCPSARARTECGPSPCAPGLNLHWTCHSLGGAWCQCNRISGVYIGTQCPTSNTLPSGTPCAGSCCINNAGGCNDPVGACIDYCCTGARSAYTGALCVANCMSNCSAGATFPGLCPLTRPDGGFNIDCHNAVDYRTCLAGGITATPPAALPAACTQITTYSCNSATPPTPCSFNPATHAWDCTCNGGNDVPYCGDIWTPCCNPGLFCSVDDGCGPCMFCDRNIGPSGMCVWQGGNPACVPPGEDWCNSATTAAPPGCTQSGTCLWGTAAFTCTGPCRCRPQGSNCPETYTVTYWQDGRIGTDRACCDVSLCMDGGADGGTAPDGGTAMVDAGTTMVDAGVFDAGFPMIDGGSAAFDAGAPLPDAGFVYPDAGTTEVPDAGPPPDAGFVFLDAGTY
jgi:hypothetical protein